jgi:hypothetical protein
MMCFQGARVGVNYARMRFAPKRGAGFPELRPIAFARPRGASASWLFDGRAVAHCVVGSCLDGPTHKEFV